MINDKKCSAIVLSAGRGSRMKSDIAKQYMMLGDYPILYYCLKVFQDSFIDEIILVCAEQDIDYCSHEFVEKYGIGKISAIVAGGEERYHSVLNGLKAIEQTDYVFIHDGARPFVTEEVLIRLFEDVEEYGSAVAAVKAKDTIKIADEKGFALSTPNRDSVYLMQTPQTFAYNKILQAYELLSMREADLMRMGIQVTDDAMVMENFSNMKIRLTEADYRNIKITTPEDLIIGRAFLNELNRRSE